MGVNGARGEVIAEVGVAPLKLCLTLGALAEIETALGLREGERLQGRLRSVSARDVQAILAALLKGGGLDDGAAAAAARDATPEQAARGVALAFAAAARQ